MDFGHAKQIFEDADVFPSIIVARKPADAPAPETARACAIPREQLRIDDLGNQIDIEGFDVERSQLGASAWTLEPKTVVRLLSKIREAGTPLAEFAAAKPLMGIKTGFNRGVPHRLADSGSPDRGRPGLCGGHQALRAGAGHRAVACRLGRPLDDSC